MERGQFQLIIEARNQAEGTLRQFGSQLRRQMAEARQQVQQTAKSMRGAGEDLQFMGRGGQFAGRALQTLSVMALRPMLSLLALSVSGVMALGQALVSVIGAVVNLAAAIVTKLIAALRSLLAMGTRVVAVFGVGLTIALGVAANKAASFEGGMRNVNSIMRLSEDQFYAMSESVLDLSTKLPQTADVLASGLYQVASAGYMGAEGLQLLEAAATAAVAGLAETDQSVVAITKTLAAYQLAAQDATYVSDILFKVVEKGQIMFPELAGGMGMVVDTAASAGVSIEELGAAIAALTLTLEPAQVFTSLNRLMLTFLDPPKELAKVLASLGLEEGRTIIQTQGLMGALDALSQMAEGNAASLASVGIEGRAMRAVLGLVRGDAALTKTFLEEMYRATGSTARAFAEQSKALSVQWQLAKSSVAALGITIGSLFLPALQQVVQSINRVTTSMRDWIKAHPELAAKFSAMGDAVGAMLEQLEGRIEVWLQWLGENWEWIWAFCADRVLAASDWIAEAIGKIVGAIQYLSQNRGVIRQWAQDFVDACIQIGQAIANYVIGRIEALKNSVRGLLSILDVIYKPQQTYLRWASSVPEFKKYIPQGMTRPLVGQMDQMVGGARGAVQAWNFKLKQSTGGGGFWGGMMGAAQAGGQQYRAGWQNWRQGIGAAAGAGAGGQEVGPGGMQQVGPNAWFFPGSEIAEAVAQAAPEIGAAVGAEVADAVTTYTATQQVEWGQAMSSLAEVEGRIADALYYGAWAAGYQEDITAAAREKMATTGTTESIQELVAAQQTLQGFLARGGQLAADMAGAGGMVAPGLQFAPQGQTQYIIAPNVTVNGPASAEEFAQVGYDLFWQIWNQEIAADEGMYDGWTGG